MASIARRVPGRRWIIGVLLGAGVLVNYIDRINLSVAAPQLQREFGLSPVELGLLFSAFFWSYSLLQVPGGMVLDRFGVTRVGRWGAFLWAVASTITAVASGFAGIFAARVLLGVAAPVITGFIVGITHSFAGAFLVAGVVLLVGIFSYVVILGRIEPIPEPVSGAGTVVSGAARR